MTPISRPMSALGILKVDLGENPRSAIAASVVCTQPVASRMALTSHVTFVTLCDMAMGKSRRIVIDVDDVDLKRRLYSALVKDGLSLKDWFVARANDYLADTKYDTLIELPALRVAEPQAKYGSNLPREKP